MIKCHRKHLEQRCSERGVEIASAMPCVVSMDGDMWTVDVNHASYPRPELGVLSFKCVPDCTTSQFPCEPGFCCEENPFDGTNSCQPCASSSSSGGGSSSSCAPGECYYCGYDYWDSVNYGQMSDPSLCPGGSTAIGPFEYNGQTWWNCRKFVGPFGSEVGEQMMMDPAFKIQNCPMDDPDYLMPAVFQGICCGGSCSPLACSSSSSVSSSSSEETSSSSSASSSSSEETSSSSSASSSSSEETSSSSSASSSSSDQTSSTSVSSSSSTSVSSSSSDQTSSTSVSSTTSVSSSSSDQTSSTSVSSTTSVSSSSSDQTSSTSVSSTTSVSSSSSDQTSSTTSVSSSSSDQTSSTTSVSSSSSDQTSSTSVSSSTSFCSIPIYSRMRVWNCASQSGGGGTLTGYSMQVSVRDPVTNQVVLTGTVNSGSGEYTYLGIANLSSTNFSVTNTPNCCGGSISASYTGTCGTDRFIGYLGWLNSGC